jgi:hypothetical protein
MARFVIAVDVELKVASSDLAGAWNQDEEAAAAGAATVETAPPGDFFGVMELVVVPAGVGLAVNAVTALVGKMIARLRPQQPDQPELEIAEMTGANGDQVVVVRLREIPR